MPCTTEQQLMPFIALPEEEYAPTSYHYYQSSLSLLHDISDLDTSGEGSDFSLDASALRSPSPATNSEKATPSPLCGRISFTSPIFEFPTSTFSPTFPQHTSLDMPKFHRTDNDKKSVKFDLSANIEYEPGSTLTSGQDPCALLRSAARPASILLRRPGDIPLPAHPPERQSSPTLLPSPKYESFFCPLGGAVFDNDSSFNYSPPSPGVFTQVPIESSSQPLLSHSTLLDEFECSTATYDRVAANKRPLEEPTLPPKRFRTDPSARRRGSLPGTSAVAPDNRRLPATLRREPCYGSCLQRSASTSAALAAFFGDSQSENRQ